VIAQLARSWANSSDWMNPSKAWSRLVLLEGWLSHELYPHESRSRPKKALLRMVTYFASVVFRARNPALKMKARAASGLAFALWARI